MPLIVECKYDRADIAGKRTFQRKDGPPVEIRVHKRRTLLVACRYRIVRVEDGSVLAEGRVETESIRDVRHAIPNKDAPAHSLVLSDKDRRLFDVRRLEETDRALQREVAASLAKGISEAVYEHVTRHLP